MKEVNDTGKLNSMVEVHNQALDEKGIEDFIAEKFKIYPEIKDELPALKIWLIPAENEEKTPSVNDKDP